MKEVWVLVHKSGSYSYEETNEVIFASAGKPTKEQVIDYLDYECVSSYDFIKLLSGKVVRYGIPRSWESFEFKIFNKEV